jgi:hypothetical protein
LKEDYVHTRGQCKRSEYFDCRKAKLTFPHYIFSFDQQGIQLHFSFHPSVEAKLIFDLIQEAFFHSIGR